VRPPIQVNLAVEDRLSEAVVKRILHVTGRPYAVRACYGKEGFGYLKRHVTAFNEAAKHFPWIVLADLDQRQCAPALIRDWLGFSPEEVQNNFVFRVAVREVEAWLMADRQGFSAFLSVPTHRIPPRVDGINDPKLYLINLARRSRRKAIRDDIVPPSDSTSRIGKNYNGRLIEFVNRWWDLSTARRSSPSLDRAVRALEGFTPTS